MSLDEKINILFYLFGTYLVLLSFTLLINIKKNLSLRILDRLHKNINDWDSKGEYDRILENIDAYIDQFPGDSHLLWVKARSLYKRDKFSEARKLFSQLVESEPMWKDDAEKYIVSIDYKMSE